MRLLFFILFQFNSCACIWDSDTLKVEAEGLPSVVDTIAGHFKRYPKSYYQFRIDRLINKKYKSPYDYDDLAVAYDRLGDSKKAIYTIEAKRQLDLSKYSDKESVDIRYRSLANLGTFQAHLWFRQTKDKKDPKLLDKSIDTLSKAIELNPDAHFGREKVQLDFIKWVKSKPVMKDEFINQGIVDYKLYVDAVDSNLNDTLKGLQGLIVLGEAWQSPDVFISMSIVLSNMNHSNLSLLANLKAIELINDGKSVIPELKFTKKVLIDSLIQGSRLYKSEQENVQKQYNNLRTSGRYYQQTVETYITERVKRGDHPDINPKFWLDLKLPKKYQIYEPWITRDMREKSPLLFIILLVICVLLYFKNLDRLAYKQNLKL